MFLKSQILVTLKVFFRFVLILEGRTLWIIAINLVIGGVLRVLKALLTVDYILQD